MQGPWKALNYDHLVDDDIDSLGLDLRLATIQFVVR